MDSGSNNTAGGDYFQLVLNLVDKFIKRRAGINNIQFTIAALSVIIGVSAVLYAILWVGVSKDLAGIFNSSVAIAIMFLGLFLATS